VREQWANYWKTGNVQGLQALYVNDAIFLPAAGRLLDGPGDIGKYLAHVIDTSECMSRLQISAIQSNLGRNDPSRNPS
jgi:ketosteroid isomerase-like protein